MSEEKNYIHYLEHSKVKNNIILLESQHGKTLGGNIAAIARELATAKQYGRFKIFVSCKAKQMEKMKQLLVKLGIKKIRPLETGSRQYFKVLATAKYLINDNTFVSDFIKRPEQIYLNTWHGTPLKTLGKQIKDDYGMIGNAQRNFLCADYLLCPNEFTMQCLTRDYMLENMGNTKLLLTGYPRNTVFLEKEKGEQIRKVCGLEGMQVYAYLPTWRGTTNQVENEEQNEKLKEYFLELDAALTDRQRVYVKLHPMNEKGMDLSDLKHIVPFPKEYETYEFLNAMDGLITDYSSVFFDYAITGKKIILFTYDKEAYTSERGFYFPMEELPFPQVDTVEALADYINRPKEYDDTAFVQRYCGYDNVDVTKALCQRVILEKPSALIEEKELKDNGKPNVLLYAGPLATNRTTEQFLELVAGLNTDAYNYTLLYKMDEVRYRQKRLQQLPQGMNFFGFYEAHSLPQEQLEQYMNWRDSKKAPSGEEQACIRMLARYEKQRLFHKCRIDYVLDFSGSNDETLLILSEFPMSRIQMKQMAPPINIQLTGVLPEDRIEIGDATQLEALLRSKLKDERMK